MRLRHFKTSDSILAYEDLALAVLWLAVGASRQQPENLRGEIHGFVISHDGHLVKNMRLFAVMHCPSACAFWMSETISNQAGEYRFQRLPLGRKYDVFAYNTKAGYPPFGPAAAGSVEVMVGEPVVELRIDLPLKVGSPQRLP
jgi:hypothetical protein